MTPPNSLTRVHGADSYWLLGEKVEVFVTEQGGHLAPVRFKLKHRWVSPLSLPPWTPDEAPGQPTLLQMLRGDFFCLPFGPPTGQAPYHGETANGPWTLVNRTPRQLHLHMATHEPAGQIDKILTIDPRERAIYQEHRLSGYEGHYNYGHHAIFHFPEDEGEGQLGSGPIRFGQVKPEPFTNPAIGEYGCLQTGARFESLKDVPLATGGNADLTRFPAREGFEDLVMFTAESEGLAWNGITFDGYIWLTLKDTRTLPSTLLWFSHGGRHQEPWKGCHRRRLGMEEVCSHFCDDVETSREDRLEGDGIPTTAEFHAHEPSSIRLIYVCHPVSRHFGRIRSVTVAGKKRIQVVGEGDSVNVPVNWSFLRPDITETNVEA